MGLGGRLIVESQVGNGTVVRTILPAAKGDAAAVLPAASAVLPGRRGRILVVDDEAMLGTAVRRMLSAEHEVLATTSAQDALDRTSNGERFDIILCDLMMPRVTGMDLHAELLRQVLEQVEKLVFMTGGAFTTRSREFLEHVRNPRIEKPFDVGSIRALVHGMLR